MRKKYYNVETPGRDMSSQYSSTDFKNDATSNETSAHLSRVLLATRAASIGIWEYVFEQKRLIADDVLMSHFGKTVPGYSGNYEILWDYVHPDDKKRVAEEYKKALNDRADLAFEYRITWDDGSLHYIKLNAVFQWDVSGKPISLVGSSQNITSQKEAGYALRESEAKFRTFYENIQDALLLTVTDGNILAANPAASEIFQMTEEEICRAGRLGLVDLSDPRLQPLIAERARNGWAKGEVTCIRKDGTTFPGEITSVIFVNASGENRTSMVIRDLSESRNAEKNLIATSCALQQAVNGLNKILDSSLDMICSVNEEGRFVTVSSAAERILGYKPDELTNTSFIDLVLKEDVEITLKEDVKIRNGQSVTIFENRYIHKNGSIVPLLWSAAWDDNDKVTYCIAKDVTEKKVLEKAVELERQRFLDLYAQAPSCMGVIKGPTYVYELANPLYLQLIDKKDIIGKTVKEVLPELESQGIFELLDGVYNTGETFSASEMLVKFDFHGDGQLVDTYLNFIYQAHRDIENKIDGIFFFAIDVTEQVLSRKKIEESAKRYRQIVETAQEGIWLIDENNITTFVNKKLCEILEYSEEEMMGREIYDFMDEDGKELAATMMVEKQEGQSGQKNFKYIAKSGKEIWTTLSANPLFNEDNRYKGALAMVTDITERIVLEKQLLDEKINNQKEIAKAAISGQEKERREIGAELHDNVNQLLATANLFLGHSLHLAEGYKPFIINSQEYVLTAIEEIRKLTKALVGPSKAKEMDLIVSIKDLVTDILRVGEIKIRFAHDSYCEPVSDDGLKLVIYRIIQEQLNNILKHAEATEIAIDLKYENGRISLAIEDNGKGFDTNANRNGIGLKNIQHRAEIYNGEVSIRSSPGNGCTVSVIFQ
ncbi:sensor histidine kinase [Ginsengibacter hankyongi]|nr:PAS domain S-box protein [Ginsengibacter hankyongi]